MGDNRTGSSDSRAFGLIPIENIIGKAWFTYWPVGEFGTVPHVDYPELNAVS
jgi:signal peptidase I